MVFLAYSSDDFYYHVLRAHSTIQQSLFLCSFKEAVGDKDLSGNPMLFAHILRGQILYHTGSHSQLCFPVVNSFSLKVILKKMANNPKYRSRLSLLLVTGCSLGNTSAWEANGQISYHPISTELHLMWHLGLDNLVTLFTIIIFIAFRFQVITDARALGWLCNFRLYSTFDIQPSFHIKLKCPSRAAEARQHNTGWDTKIRNLLFGLF